MMRKEGEPFSPLVREVSRTEVQERFPGLYDIRENVRKVVTRHFRHFQIHPPFVISPQDQLNSTTAKFLTEEQKSISELPYILFELGSGAITSSPEYLQSRLATSHGRIQLTDSMLEEYIHAATTSVDKKGARCGFVIFPEMRRQDKRFTPGKVYEIQENEYQQDAIKATQQRGSLFLTENATRFLTNQLLLEVCPELEGQFNIALVQNIHKRHGSDNLLWMGERNPALIRRLVDALKTGQIDRLDLKDLRNKANLKDVLQLELDPLWEITNLDMENHQMLNTFLFPNYDPSI